jgi:xanthine dehydrogenase YagS FAD-binding subunit
MNKFDYIRVATPAEALEALATHRGAAIMAGGTDLLPLMKDDLASPQVIVDLAVWEAGRRIEQTPEGLKIGAMATLASVAGSAIVQEQFTALADACNLSAAPQLRNMGTIGGSLLQQTRCWYYRGTFDCWLKGGQKCFARNGQNEQHAIMSNAPEQSSCVSAHPSDPAAALLALDAAVEYATPDGYNRISVGSLFSLPTAARRSMTTLPENSILTAVIIPYFAGPSRSTYVKSMPRAAWAFALAGVALSIRFDASLIRDSRVALSGIAPIPWRIQQVEALMRGRNFESLDPDHLARVLTSSATPLSMNGYKVPILQGLFREALARISGPADTLP